MPLSVAATSHLSAPAPRSLSFLCSRLGSRRTRDWIPPGAILWVSRRRELNPDSSFSATPALYLPVHFPNTTRRVSVNLLDNGTAINLAKVPGSRFYVEMVERLMMTLPSRNSGCSDGVGVTLARAARYLLGISDFRDATTIAQLVGTLKAASEETLGKSLDGYAVSITAPWQQCWRDQSSWSSDINYALKQSGLQPWFPAELDPVYLEEARTTLAAFGRWLCEPFEDVDSRRNDDIVERSYYIR